MSSDLKDVARGNVSGALVELEEGFGRTIVQGRSLRWRWRSAAAFIRRSSRGRVGFTTTDTELAYDLRPACKPDRGMSGLAVTTQ